MARFTKSKIISMIIMKSLKRVITLYCQSDKSLTWRKFVFRLGLSSALVVLMSIADVNPAMAAGDGEGGGNKQTPVQVIVQIVLTTIVIKIIDPWVIRL
jgi:hypothetical protein